MRRNYAVYLLLALSLITVHACKSVETTSAMLHNQHGNYEEAINQANLALEKNPNDAEAHFQLGISYSYTGDMKRAYEEFQTAARLDPKKLNDVENNIKHNWAQHFNNGVSEFQGNNLEGASIEFEKATFADPRQVKGWLNLAKVRFAIAQEDTTRFEEAYATVDSLMLRTTPDIEEYADALELSGKVMIQRGEKEQAVELFEKLMLDDPANFEVVENIGLRFLNERNFEDAVLFLEMAADGRRKTDSEDFELYYNIGVAYYNMKRYLQAIEANQNALNLEPTSQTANKSLLLNYYQAQLYDEAILQGQKYTEEIAPDDPTGWQILSLSYSKKNMKIKAEEAAKKFEELTQ
jgi:tetratricopeptide (TPR) repeat protein